MDVLDKRIPLSCSALRMFSSASSNPGVSSAYATRAVSHRCTYLPVPPSPRGMSEWAYRFELCLGLLSSICIGTQGALNAVPEAGSIHAACGVSISSRPVRNNMGWVVCVVCCVDVWGRSPSSLSCFQKLHGSLLASRTSPSRHSRHPHQGPVVRPAALCLTRRPSTFFKFQVHSNGSLHVHILVFSTDVILLQTYTMCKYQDTTLGSWKRYEARYRNGGCTL